MALPNLTRDQAVERAALVTVDSYRIDLDLTDGAGAPGEKTFRSVTTVEFDALAGADTYIDIAADTVQQRHPQRDRDSTSPATTSPPASPLPGLAERNIARRRRRLPLLQHRRGPAPLRRPRRRRGLPLLAVRNRRRQADVRVLRPARPQGHLRRHRHRARALGGGLQRRHRSASTRPATPRRHTFATTPRMSTYLVALIAGPYAVWDDAYTDEHGEIPLGLFCRKSLAEFMDADRLVHRNQAGLRLLPPQLRRAVRVRQVRPAVRARSSTPARWRTPAP